jgi:hypothetical protein
MKRNLLQRSHPLLVIALLGVCISTLPAAEVTIAAPDSPMLRFALGKLAAALQQRGDSLKRLPHDGAPRGAAITVLTSAEGTGRFVQAGGVAEAGTLTPPALAAQLDRDGAEALKRLAAFRAQAKPSPTLECELTDIEACLDFCAAKGSFPGCGLPLDHPGRMREPRAARRSSLR